MRLVGARKEMAYTPDMWASPYYGSLWGYYGYGWGTVYVSGSAREDTVVTIETLVFDVPKDKLLWAIYLVAAAITIATESEIVWVFLLAGIICWLVKAPPIPRAARLTQPACAVQSAEARSG